ncbi:MAG: hypothetical protein R2745_11640 [Vicinamibacterales bacterium]
MAACGKPVDERCKDCGEGADEINFCEQLRLDCVPDCRDGASSYRPSLVSSRERRRIVALSSPNAFRTFHIAPVNVHRYEEEIAGRTYHIEVHAVSSEQWRARLARRPGMPTALMPFYGSTPELAARELANWLSLVASRTRGSAAGGES